MLELFGFAWVTITFTCCVAAVSTRRSVLRWMKARTDRKRLDDTVEIVRRPMRKVATYAALVALAVPAGVLAGGTALPGPAGGFSGGTVTGATTFTSPVVFTGDNASGTGTLRIRPSDEDTQLVLCEASNNAATEVCSTVQHYNTSAITSSMIFGTNLYLNSSSLPQRHNTGFGAGYIQTVASSTVANNGIYMGIYGTGGTLTSLNTVAATGASTATTFIGASPGASVGTMTLDIRGPILNGGSATCNGILAGAVCLNDGSVHQYAATASNTVQSTDATAAAYHGAYDTAGTLRAAFAYANSSVSDADLADKSYVYSNSKVIAALRADDVAANTMAFQWMDNTSGTGVQLASMNGDGRFAPTFYGSQSNCSDGAGAAACSAAPAGSVVVDDGATTVVVSTTAVTANSQIQLTYDSSLGTKLGVTCNTNYVDQWVSARTAATSFTITLSADPATANPACLSYSIIN